MGEAGREAEAECGTEPDFGGGILGKLKKSAWIIRCTEFAGEEGAKRGEGTEEEKGVEDGLEGIEEVCLGEGTRRREMTTDELLEATLERDREAAAEVGEEPRRNVRLTAEVAERFEQALRRIAAAHGVSIGAGGARTTRARALERANAEIARAIEHPDQGSLDDSVPEEESPEAAERARTRETNGYTATVHHRDGTRSYQIHYLRQGPHEMRTSLIHEGLHVYAYERGIGVPTQLPRDFRGTRDLFHGTTRCMLLGGGE
jgi:hypothetical protein